MDPRTTPEPPPVHEARWVPLTQGKFALVDTEDFDQVTTSHWAVHRIKSSNTIYAKSTINKRCWTLHRWLWLKVWILPEVKELDHEDGDGLNCRRKNLRPATRSQNAINRKINKSNTSGFKGVHRCIDRSNWRACIWVESRLIHLGMFPSAEEAARAYDRAAVKHFGEFARLNFQKETP